MAYVSAHSSARVVGANAAHEPQGNQDLRRQPRPNARRIIATRLTTEQRASTRRAGARLLARLTGRHALSHFALILPPTDLVQHQNTTHITQSALSPVIVTSSVASSLHDSPSRAPEVDATQHVDNTSPRSAHFHDLYTTLTFTPVPYAAVVHS